MDKAPTQKTDDQPEVVSRRRGFLNNMSVYPLEMTVSMITMILVASGLSYGVFALFNYMYSPEESSLGYGTLWFAASSIVWLPIAFIFYVRSRGYMQQHPEVVTNSVQRAFVLIYQIVMLITVICFALAAVYTLLLSFVNVGNVGETLVRSALPSFISAVLFLAAFAAYFKRPIVSRKWFGVGMLVVSILIILPMAVYTVISLRSANTDTPKVQDLQAIDSEIRQYHRDEQRLPSSLSDLDDDLELNLPLSTYSYETQGSDSFELCATFATSTERNDDRHYVSSRYSTDYGNHDSGEDCFTSRVYQYSTYDTYNYRFDN